jgi:hypothetical protein
LPTIPTVVSAKRDRTSEYGEIDVVSRKTFLDEWDYSAGQHLTMLGPTQRGKTTLAIELLNRSISPQLKAVILAGKPPGRDKTMAGAANKLNLRIVEEWPPTPQWGDKKRNGYVLRPRHTMKDSEKDNANLRYQFKHAIQDTYASSKPRILVADEAYHIQVTMKLKAQTEDILMRGAPVVGCWSLLQRGRFVSYLVYDSPEHIFIYYDPDRTNQKRYAEIGGVDPEYVERVVATLKMRTATGGKNTISEALYIRRSGPQLCIVDMD